MASFTHALKSMLPVSISQILPPNPSLTEHNLPSQTGKVFIVTGGASGVGYQLVSFLFHAGAKVYIAGRSEEKARQAIKEIQSSSQYDSASVASLQYLPLELDDLSTIKSSVDLFKRKESRLDVLWNNAGVSLPPSGSVSKQGYELQLATNCLGPYLFTQLLLPLLQANAKIVSPGSVRVVWTASQAMEHSAPTGGVNMPNPSEPFTDQTRNYASSKAGNWFLAAELARDVGHVGILSVAQNPGALKTNLLRHTSWLFQSVVSPLLHEAKYGAYTELWAGLSPELTEEHNGAYIIPWGRLHPCPRQDILDATKREWEGGTGRSWDFERWCNKETAMFR